jgi:hypothetical protein
MLVMGSDVWFEVICLLAISRRDENPESWAEYTITCRVMQNRTRDAKCGLAGTTTPFQVDFFGDMNVHTSLKVTVQCMEMYSHVLD